MHSPTNVHWVAVKRILRYLKYTLNHGLVYQPGSHKLVAYSDADYAGDPDDRHSTGGFCSPCPVLKLSTGNLPTQLLSCLGFDLYFVILMYFPHVPGSGVIISALYLWPPIPYFIPEPSI
ncbi:putative RNA-directed DNA polymerase [Rosa chinensis]|uniref:Putative RNA-directed DNA polymerase n=1 Tax=Rosa chinensis TaxID=74649 RepID=A0A2P6R9V2_ROSCH|nr:putative RNA-directed DNA polymerase [Rosa chinensis]